MTTKLSIKGMSCINCQKHMTKELLAIPGVTSADVDFKTGSANVAHTEAITRETFEAAVDEAGYTLLKVS